MTESDASARIEPLISHSEGYYLFGDDVRDVDVLSALSTVWIVPSEGRNHGVKNTCTFKDLLCYRAWS